MTALRRRPLRQFLGDEEEQVTQMDFRILGPIEAVRAGQPVRLAGPQQRSVLAALLLARGRMVSVDRLVRLLWAEHPPATARTQLRKRVSELRAALGADRIRSWREGTRCGWRRVSWTSTGSSTRYGEPPCCARRAGWPRRPQPWRRVSGGGAGRRWPTAPTS
ncbi:winged helix-turn-helix domain-containing protein [Micromonospora sp. M12]